MTLTRILPLAAVLMALSAGPVLAEGDAAQGEKVYRRCKA
jgi:cytochrome c2